MTIDTRNRRLGPWNSTKPIIDAINDLENTNVKVVWFESISSGTSGSFSPPENSTILLDQWAGGVDVLVSGEESGTPNFRTVLDLEGATITGTLDESGNWTISGTPADGYNISLIYVYRIALSNFNYQLALETATIEGPGTLSLIGGLRKEMTGFTDTAAANCTYSFVDGTRTATVQPVSGRFPIWVQGKEFVIDSAKTTVIGNVEGVHMIYFDSNGDLQSTQDIGARIIDSAFVFSLYWNATDEQVEGGLHYEQHGVTMDGATHGLWHKTLGAQYGSGSDVTYIDTDASGNLDASAEIGLSHGTIYDEDITINSTDSGQVVAQPAQIPVWYKTGASGVWRKDTADDFPVKSFVGGDSLLAYNLNTAGTWSQAEVGNNEFVLSHIYFTNDDDEPFAAIQGENAYANIPEARDGALVEARNLQLSGLPSAEQVLLYTIIYQTATGYTNDVKARARSIDSDTDYVDWRQVRISSGGGSATGSVTGPTEATDNAIARYDGVTGTLIQDSDVEVNDSGEVVVNNGVIVLGETTTPTAVTDFAKIYSKSDNELYFQDGAGVEHKIALV